MNVLAQAAPAKLNLHLGIHATLDERRYHRAESLMVALDVCDEVSLREDANLVEPSVACDPPVGIPAEQNTAYRAAVALAKRFGKTPAVRIYIRKVVPDQSGMGGSSSDAAAVLRLLCNAWRIDVADPRVADAARSVGADVPFFLDPVPTLLVGAGDVVAQKFPRLSDPAPVVLVRPPGPGISTKVAYAAFDECHEQPADSGPLCELLRSGCADPQELAQHLANNLDPIACRLLSGVAEVRDWLLSQDDVLGGQVTGSGSCVFGICATDEAATRVADAARMRFGGWSRAAHIV